MDKANETIGSLLKVQSDVPRLQKHIPWHLDDPSLSAEQILSNQAEHWIRGRLVVS